MSTRGSPGDKYGLELDQYLSSSQFELSGRAPPSESEIQHAIQSLSNPQDVSCATLETILAMGWTPAIVHLDILLSASKDNIFQTCKELLQQYCAEGRGLLDHAYGFLCLQVMALSVWVATLSQTNELKPFLLAIAKQPPDQPILIALHSRVCDVERKALHEKRGGDGNALLLGWYQDGTGKLSCLPQMGGFTIHDAIYLVAKMWGSRSQFLHASRQTANIFPRWGSFLRVIGITLIQNFRDIGPTFADVKVPNQRRCWISFMDMIHRYALCSSDNENFLLLPLMLHCPPSSEPWPNFEPETTVDALDSDRIAEAFLQKLSSTPTPPSQNRSRIISAVFGYTCTNVAKSNSEGAISRIFEAAFEYFWALLYASQQMQHQQQLYGRPFYHVLKVLSVLPLMLKKHQKSALKVVSEKLFDILGRIMLFETTFFGMIVSIRENPEVKQIIRDLQAEMDRLGLVLSRLPKATDFGTTILFPSWYKPIRCLEHLNAMWPPKELPAPMCAYRDYPWGKAWLRLGASLGLSESDIPYRNISCMHSRCAAPDVPLGWECKGCQVKRYCSRRCQQADWLHPLNPHIAECSKELATKWESNGP